MDNLKIKKSAGTTPLISFAVLFTFVWLMLNAPVGYAQSTGFSCRIVDLNSESCNGPTQAIVLKMSDLANAHAELPSQSNYKYGVCCTGVNDDLSVEENPAICSQGRVVALSNETNAHVSGYVYSFYPYKICLMAAYGKIDCRISHSQCKSDEVCLFSLSNSSYGTLNAHVGDCSAYDNRVCCWYSYELRVDALYPKSDEGYLVIYRGRKARVMLKVINPLDEDVHVKLALGSNTPEIKATSYFSEHEHDEQRDELSLYLKPHESIYVPVTIYGSKEGKYDSYDGLYIHDGSGASGAYTVIPIEILAPPSAEEGVFPTPGITWMQMVVVVLLAALMLNLK